MRENTANSAELRGSVVTLAVSQGSRLGSLDLSDLKLKLEENLGRAGEHWHHDMALGWLSSLTYYPE